MSALAANVPECIKKVTEHLRTHETLNETVGSKPFALRHASDFLKTQKMCDDAVKKCLRVLKDVPDHLKTREMCDKALFDKAFWRYTFSLQYVPDWFVTQQQLKLWHHYDDCFNYGDDNELIEWYKGYHKQKAQKASIKEELVPIAWHPSRWWNWCVPKDEKKETEIFF